MAILSSDWIYDDKIDALGQDHLAVRCFIAALAAANPDGTLGPVAPAWIRMRLLPCGISNEEALEAWKAIESVELVVTWEDGGKTWAILPGWWNHASRGQNVTRAAKSPEVPAELLSRFRSFAEGYLRCAPGRRSLCKSKTYDDFPGNSRDTPGIVHPSPSSSPSKASKQAFSSSPGASEEPEQEAGWPACWCRMDHGNEISGEIRSGLESEWARAGGNGTGSDETAKALLEAVRLDAAEVAAGLKSLALRAEPVRKPGAWLLDRVRKRRRDQAVADRVRGAAAAKRAPPDMAAVEQNRAGLHATMWAAGKRPRGWADCPCGACLSGRECRVELDALTTTGAAGEHARDSGAERPHAG